MTLITLSEFLKICQMINFSEPLSPPDQPHAAQKNLEKTHLYTAHTFNVYILFILTQCSKFYYFIIKNNIKITAIDICNINKNIYTQNQHSVKKMKISIALQILNYNFPLKSPFLGICDCIFLRHSNSI